MYIAWTKHIEDPAKKEQFVNYLRNNREIFDVALNILNLREKELDFEETSASSYDKPNWDYRQADRNGYRRCLKQMKLLFNLDHQK